MDLDPHSQAARSRKRGLWMAGTNASDFFVNLLDMGATWRKSATEGMLEGRDRKSGALKWTGTVVDLVFGSNAQLRAAPLKSPAQD